MNKNNKEIGVRLEIPTEIIFVEKETATEWLKKSIASHQYDD